MTYRIVHKTRYTYSAPVSLCHNEARLLPRTFSHQTCTLSGLSIDPEPIAFREREDFFGNRVCYFAIQQPHKSLTVTATSTVRVQPPPAPGLSGPSWEDVRRRLETDSAPQTRQTRVFTLDSSMILASPDLARYAGPSFTPGRPYLKALHDLMQRIHRDFAFVPGFTAVATPLSVVLKHRRGVCQDFAHLAIGCLRSLGLPARYVSGYIETLPPPGGRRLIGADASHAWFSAFDPDRNWIDFDPTNNQIPSGRHITLAWGRDYADIPPLKGVVFGSGKHQLSVSVDVRNLTA